MHWLPCRRFGVHWIQEFGAVRDFCFERLPVAMPTLSKRLLRQLKKQMKQIVGCQMMRRLLQHGSACSDRVAMLVTCV